MRIDFLMIRKRLMSKRNFMGDMIDREKVGKLMKEWLRNLSFNRYNHSRRMGRMGYEYEFSCSNSPEPVIVHPAKNKSQRFPCIRLPKVIEDFVEDEPVYPTMHVCMARTPEYTFNIQIERRSPLFSPSPEEFSNYSSDDEGDGKYGQVDHKAEEFITKFHDQLRKQAVH
ncbi:hypothetical protein ACJRO7_028000 [Eucalyptus globulus]|uniref:Uncharacterized protein n=1 Tax=Eucalyptus globulus TaxID=34317 RepID=A0ABD3JYZ4_EUCGL